MKFLGSTREIRTVSIDSSVIFDSIVPFVSSTSGLSSADKERINDSLHLIEFLFSVKVNTIGTDIVRKEISYNNSLFSKLYDSIFDNTAIINKETKRLAKVYVEQLNIKPSDALIIASLSEARCDCLLSWDKEDIVSNRTVLGITKINKERNKGVPLLITPKDFLQRVFLSQGKHIVFSPNPLPLELHLRFSSSTDSL